MNSTSKGWKNIFSGEPPKQGSGFHGEGAVLFMRVTYNPEAPSLFVVNEVKYYMAISVLKKMLTNGIIAPENYRKATVALAEKYRVSRYDI